jgi:hypothetical protein
MIEVKEDTAFDIVVVCRCTLLYSIKTDCVVIYAYTSLTVSLHISTVSVPFWTRSAQCQHSISIVLAQCRNSVSTVHAQ